MPGTFVRGFGQNWATPLVNIPDAMKLAKEPCLLDYSVALGGNKNTTYYHALFVYNQWVNFMCGKCGNKNIKFFCV